MFASMTAKLSFEYLNLVESGWAELQVADAKAVEAGELGEAQVIQYTNEHLMKKVDSQKLESKLDTLYIVESAAEVGDGTVAAVKKFHNFWDVWDCSIFESLTSQR